MPIGMHPSGAPCLLLPVTVHFVSFLSSTGLFILGVICDACQRRTYYMHVYSADEEGRLNPTFL